jgi:hypothetical protein
MHLVGCSLEISAHVTNQRLDGMRNLAIQPCLTVLRRIAAHEWLILMQHRKSSGQVS